MIHLGNYIVIFNKPWLTLTVGEAWIAEILCPLPPKQLLLNLPNLHRNCYYRIYFTFANQTKIFILFKSIVKSVSSFLKSELRLVTSLNKVFWFKLILVLRTTLLAFTSLKLPVDILQQLFLGDQVTCPGCRLNAFACKCLQGTEDGRYLHLYSS